MLKTLKAEASICQQRWVFLSCALLGCFAAELLVLRWIAYIQLWISNIMQYLCLFSSFSALKCHYIYFFSSQFRWLLFLWLALDDDDMFTSLFLYLNDLFFILRIITKRFCGFKSCWLISAWLHGTHWCFDIVVCCVDCQTGRIVSWHF